MHPAVRPMGDEFRRLERPLLLAAFSGAAGNSAAAAIAHLVEQWQARPVADLDPDSFYDFTALRPIVRLHEGMRVIDWPEARFFAARPEGAERDVVLFVGPEPHFRWRQYTEAVRDVIEGLGVEEVLLVNSFAGAAPHTRPSPVHLVGADEKLARRFGLPTRAPRYQGPATYSMALGVMLRECGIRVATLSAIAPFYVGVDPSPYAVRALVEAIARGVGVRVSMGMMDERMHEVNEHAQQAMARSEQLRTFVQNLEQQFDESSGELGGGSSMEPGDGGSIEDLMQDVESFLRDHRDLSEPGRSAGSGQRPL